MKTVHCQIYVVLVAAAGVAERPFERSPGYTMAAVVAAPLLRDAVHGLPFDHRLFASNSHTNISETDLRSKRPPLFESE